MLNAGQLEVMRPVAADDALHFLPGAVVSTQGQRGGLSSLFVRGGESTYNKVIVDGVPVNDPGGIFDFGVLPLAGADRMEFVRGAQSTLYGSDAMTSVVQVFTRSGSTPVPELRFGADGGNLETANGYASLAGANGRFDYNLFGDQFNTMGQGPNDDYSNSLEGGNVGVKLTDWAALRLRARHSNSATGVQGYWNFNGDPILPPDFDQRARQNNLLASAELDLTGPSRWQHRFTGFEYALHRTNIQPVNQPGRVDPFGDQIDTPFHAITDINRAGFDYQGDYTGTKFCGATNPRDISSRSCRDSESCDRPLAAGAMPPLAESTPKIDPACLPRLRPISLSDCPAFHRAHSSTFCCLDNPGRPICAIATLRSEHDTHHVAFIR